MRGSSLLALFALLGLAVDVPAAPRPVAGLPAFAAQSVLVGGVPIRIAAGDLDGDGDPDVATLGGDASAWALTIVLNGAGGFAPGWTGGGHVNDDQRFDLELADGDGDGDLDAFVIVDFGSPRLLLNAGDATFDVWMFIPAFAGRGEQEVGDFDGDADVDIAYYELDIIPYLGGLEKTGSSWAFDLSKETWFPGSYHQALRMALVDMAGDGQPDALLASPDTHGLEFVRAVPDVPDMPTWGPGAHTLLTVPCHDVAGGDLDGDGDDEAIVSVSGPDGVRVLLGQHGVPGPGTLYRAGPKPGALVVADLDVDGKPDVAVTHAAATTLAVLLNNGAGGLLRPIFVPAGGDPSGVAAADFDFDGDTDLAVAGGTTGEVVILENLIVP